MTIRISANCSASTSKKEGYSVILAHDGEEALLKFETLHPDLILLDIMLPGLDGWQVCREVRKKSQVPIIMLTAKGETFDKVPGAGTGGRRLCRQALRPPRRSSPASRAVLRRVGPEQTRLPTSRRSRYDKLVVNMTRYELKVDGKVIDTPPKELELLFHLASNPQPGLYPRPAAGRGLGL